MMRFVLSRKFSKFVINLTELFKLFRYSDKWTKTGRHAEMCLGNY